MGLVLSNNATSLLSADISDSAATLAITSGDEERFPTPGTGEWFPITVVDASGRENMRCTNRSGVTLTVTRGQEGSTARSFSAGSRVDVRLTSGAFMEHTRDASIFNAGTFPDARLPDRLKTAAGLIADADAVTANGSYRTDADTVHAPSAEDGMLWHTAADASNMYQEFQAFSSTERWARVMASASWGAWYRPYIAYGLADQLVPPGLEAPFAGDAAPSGWLLEAGQAVSRATYARLFLVIGTRFGNGDGSTTFNLPDVRGRAFFGKDDMGGVAALRLTNKPGGINGAVLGAYGGAEQHELAVAEMPTHNHVATVTDPGHSHNVPIRKLGQLFDGSNTEYAGYYLASETQNLVAGTATTGITVTTSNKGDGGKHNNLPPGTVRNMIIKY